MKKKAVHGLMQAGERPAPLHPPTGTIEFLPDFSSAYIEPRPVEVWVPEGYDATSSHRYPVLYMHDGQFLFHHGHAPIADLAWLWDVDTVMARLIESGEIEPAIVVAIWANFNEAPPMRLLEYMPEKPVSAEVWEGMVDKEPTIAGVKLVSDDYLKFLVTELKPFIDQNYRTRADREHTFVCGSSMGGMIAAYAIAEYPETVGGAACMSTNWTIGEGVVIDWYEAHWPEPGATKIYLDQGTATYDADFLKDQDRIDAVMRRKGYRSGEDWISRRFEGADHSPQAWRERLHVPLKFLLG